MWNWLIEQVYLRRFRLLKLQREHLRNKSVSYPQSVRVSSSGVRPETGQLGGNGASSSPFHEILVKPPGPAKSSQPAACKANIFLQILGIYPMRTAIIEIDKKI